MNYYNDNDNKVCLWLSELIKRKHIRNGIVDNRSIKEVTSKEIKEFEQCHFFAGIGGWSYAIELSNWQGKVWTASLPCQPFSAIGKNLKEKDHRHLWPSFFKLVEECRPPTIFGEQVASRAGREWLSRIQADLETLGYATGAADLCAAGIGAPHIRQRLFWVADSIEQRLERHTGNGNCSIQPGWERKEEDRPIAKSCWSSFEEVQFPDDKRRRIEPGTAALANGISERLVRLRGYGNAIVPQLAATFINSFLEVCKDNERR